MTVKEVLQSLGSWGLTLEAGLPDDIRRAIGFFGHVAIVRGKVDVEGAGDTLLTRARYVGVLRDELGRDGTAYTLEGVSTTVWLGDEDGKGQVLENKVVLTNATLTASLTAVLPAAVHLGTVHPLANPAARYTGTHQYEDPRTVITTICEAFGVEWRVNGDATLDVGTQAQLYTAVPDSIVVRRGAGADMDLVALGGTFGVQQSATDYSDRVVLMGQTVEEGAEPFAVGAVSAPSVPYFDRWGNPVKRTRLISESGQTTGSVEARAQLHFNRFNRTTTALKVTAADFETSGNFRVGDNTFVYDPETGIVNPANQRDFRGELLHPDIVRVSEVAWPVTDSHTVAFRTGAGVWLDLTRYVRWETGSNELVVGDLPKSLTNPATNVVRDRADAAPSTATPNAPTGLTLSTTSVLDPKGGNSALILASWTAPGQNTDNTVADLSHYLVQYRWTGRAPLWQSTVTALTQIELGAVIALPYEVRVAAVGRNGKTGAWSSTEGITAAADATAPPAPADPVVTTPVPGLLHVKYVGLTAAAQPMPSDTNRVDVEVGTSSSGPWVAESSLTPFAEGVHLVSAPYGSPRWVRLRAYDHAGNPSTPSAAVSGATVQTGDTDIASLSVAKLVSGISTAEITIAGRITTALTGARREVNAVGFQAWDSANNLTISLDGVNNLLTGRYRSAITGRRIEMGSVGLLGELNFYAPDGKQSFLRSYTESTGLEAIQLGSTTSTVGVTDPLWNRINYNSDEWANYRAKRHNFYYKDDFSLWRRPNGGLDDTGAYASLVMDGSGSARFYIPRDQQFQLLQRHDGVNYPKFGITGDNGTSAGRYVFEWATSATQRMEIRQSLNGSVSTLIQLFHPFTDGGNGFGAAIRYAAEIANGTGLRRVDVMDAYENVHIPLHAASFIVNSSQGGKSVPVAVRTGSLDRVQKLRPVRFHRRTRKGEDVYDDREETGFIAEQMAEVAPHLVVPSPVNGDGPSIDVMGLLAETIASVQELAIEVRKGRP